MNGKVCGFRTTILEKQTRPNTRHQMRHPGAARLKTAIFGSQRKPLKRCVVASKKNKPQFLNILTINCYYLSQKWYSTDKEEVLDDFIGWAKTFGTQKRDCGQHVDRRAKVNRLVRYGDLHGDFASQ